MNLRLMLPCVMTSLVAVLTSGCVSVEMFKNQLAYEPEHVPSRVEARASLDVAHSLSPEAEARWRAWGNGPETIGNWDEAVREVIIEDVVKSGLFASAQAGGAGDFDCLVRIRSQDLRDPDRFSAELQVCDWSSKAVVASYKQEQAMDGSQFDAFQAVIRTVMARIKAELLADARKGRFGAQGALPVLSPLSPVQSHPAAPQAIPDLSPQI